MSSVGCDLGRPKLRPDCGKHVTVCLFISRIHTQSRLEKPVGSQNQIKPISEFHCQEKSHRTLQLPLGIPAPDWGGSPVWWSGSQLSSLARTPQPHVLTGQLNNRPFFPPVLEGG